MNEFHITGVEALIVGGVRFTLQDLTTKNFTDSTPVTHRLWLKDPNQSGGGLKFGTDGLHVPGSKWVLDFNFGTGELYSTPLVITDVVLADVVWDTYGTTGMPHSTSAVDRPSVQVEGLSPVPFNSCDLMPATVGHALSFNSVGVTNRPSSYSIATGLWINGVQQRIWSPGAAETISGSSYLNFWAYHILGDAE